jgi:hypothetical protein
MKKPQVGVISAVILAPMLCISTSTRAADVMYGGNFCTPVLNDLDKIEHGNQFGVHNVAPSPATVQCPFVIAFSGALTVKEIDVTVYDRDPSSNVTCTVRGLAIDGALIWSRTRSSGGSGAPAQFIVFRPNLATLGTLNMTCTIPGATSQGLSHLTTYRLITAP